MMYAIFFSCILVGVIIYVLIPKDCGLSLKNLLKNILMFLFTGAVRQLAEKEPLKDSS